MAKILLISRTGAIRLPVLEDFTPSESGDEAPDDEEDDDEEEEIYDDDLGDSYISRDSVDDRPSLEESLRESLDIQQSQEPESYLDEDTSADFTGDYVEGLTASTSRSQPR